MKNTTLLAAEIVRRLPQLVQDSSTNSETIITNLLDEELMESAHKDIIERAERIFGHPALEDQETLRDRFAMAALTGLLANQNSVDFKWGESDIKAIYAKTSYEYANAMLEARKK